MSQAAGHVAGPLEYRYIEVRHVNGRTISGTAVVYGDTAELPWGREQIMPGAFGDLRMADLILNIMHDRKVPIARTGAGLEVIDSPQRLEFRAEVARTRAGDDALELVRSRILPGSSVEFRATRDSYEADVRSVHTATLYGFGLADRPAYPGSLVEARTAALRGRIVVVSGRLPWPLP